MKLIRDLAFIPDDVKGAAVALGNFDGLHRGHHAILEETLRAAAQRSVPAAVMTFEPHPREFFNPTGAKLRLMRVREKIAMLKGMGFAAIFMPRFNRALAETSAQEFVSRLLVEQLAVKHIVTGEDFSFGKARGGNREFLEKSPGFSYHAMEHVSDGGEMISSSAIRRKLGEGDVAGAALLLGHPYRICGHVVHGDKRGRTLGFPTANLSMHRLFLPRPGVYAVKVSGRKTGMHRGVANIGMRPTVGGTTPRAEIHIFADVGDIYGDYLVIEPTRFIRDEKKFDSLDALKLQIHADVEAAQP